VNRSVYWKAGALAFLTAVISLTAAAEEEMVWREVPIENIVYLELQDGVIVLELNPTFAPKTVARFKHLVRSDFYRGLSFYRVIEGFVAQGGDESDVGIPNTQPTIEGEFEIERDEDLPWVTVEKQDFYRAETGFTDGFAAARDDQHEWLTHCPGIIAMARGNDPDSARTDFYIVIGQAPRYLDRNLTVFGRVIHGMDVAQRIRRGPIERNGIIEADLDRSRIVRASMAEDLEPQARKAFYVMDTNSKAFAEYMKARRTRKDPFFHHPPPPVLDVCQVPVATRVEKADVPESIRELILNGSPED
jgi:peptidylprolyl isomerase